MNTQGHMRIFPVIAMLAGGILSALAASTAVAQSAQVTPGGSTTTTTSSDSIRAHNEQGRHTLTPSGEASGGTAGWFGDASNVGQIARATSGGDGSDDHAGVIDGIDRLLDELASSRREHGGIVIPSGRASDMDRPGDRVSVESSVPPFGKRAIGTGRGESTTIPAPGIVVPAAILMAFRAARRRRPLVTW